MWALALAVLLSLAPAAPDQACDADAGGDRNHQLRLAASLGQVSAVKRLMEGGGAHIDAPDETTGETALALATFEGHLRMVKTLCKLGASPHLVEAGGFTPLHFAAGRGDVAIATVLLNAGGQASAANHRGRTPLHMAAERGHAQMVALLSDRGAAAATTADHDGNLPLHVARTADVGRELLLRGGASLAVALNKWNDSPMHEAAWAGRADVLQLLADVVPSPAGAVGNAAQQRQQSSSADVPAWMMWDEGESPLLIAAQQGHASATKVLLQHSFCVRAAGPSAGLDCAAIRHEDAKRALSQV